MRNKYLILPIFLAAGLISILLLTTHQNGVVLAADIDSGPANPPAVEHRAQQATTVSSAILDDGYELIHGLTFYNGFLWGSTRSVNRVNLLPARVAKIDPTTLAVSDGVTLTNAQVDAEDIIGANDFIWTVLYTDTAQLIRVDPTSNPLTYTTAISFTGIGFGTSLDYAFGYLWVGLHNNIAQVDITDPLNPTYAMHDFSSLATAPGGSVIVNSLDHDGSHLWAALYQCNAGTPSPGCFTANTILKSDPLDPTGAYTPTTVTALFPDDMAFVNQHLYISSEAGSPGSDLYQFAADVTTYSYTNVFDQPSYGTFVNPIYPLNVWSAFSDAGGIPGTLINFDLDQTPVVTITLPSGYEDPAEIVFDDAGNLYVTTWQQPTRILKYPAPISATLSITHTATDVVLTWPHNEPDATAYQVWRSTAPYFSPGDPDATLLTIFTTPFSPTLRYTDTAAIGDVNTNYFYGIVTQNQYNLYSPVSNRVGEFDYRLVPGVPGDEYNNVIALPLDVTNEIPNADALADYVGTGVDLVLHWDPVNQIFETWIASIGFGTNFALQAGEVYWIVLNQSGPNIVSFTGSVPDQGSITYSFLGNGSDCLDNEFILPLGSSKIANADELSNSISNVELMLQWFPDSQFYETWIETIGFGTNFSVRAGYPYRSCMLGNVTWP